MDRGFEMGEKPNPAHVDAKKGDELHGFGPKTVFGELRDVLVAKADNCLDVTLASQILCTLFDGVPKKSFEAKIPLLEEMIDEAKKCQIAHIDNKPLYIYKKKIEAKIESLNKEAAPKFLEIIAKFIAAKAEEWDPLFGHEEDFKDLSFLAAWFRKLVEMAQNKPLDLVWDDCLRRILDAINGFPKDSKSCFQMMNLEMHKTGILGGMTNNLDKGKMRECLEVTN